MRGDGSEFGGIERRLREDGEGWAGGWGGGGGRIISLDGSISHSSGVYVCASLFMFLLLFLPY